MNSFRDSLTMMRHFLHRFSYRFAYRSIVSTAFTVGMIGGVGACHGILDTTNPLLIRNEDITNSTGAEGRRVALVQYWQIAMLRNVQASALVSDEETYDNSSLQSYAYTPEWVLDTRDTTAIQKVNSDNDRNFRPLTQAFWTSSLAIYALRGYGDSHLKDDYLAESFALRGHLALLMAETICAGFPMNDVDAGNRPIYGTALTTDSALKYTVAQLDSALAHGKDSTQFINLARVLKGRALLDLGQYATAATAVQNVPDDFVYQPELVYQNPFYNEQAYGDQSWFQFYMGDQEGGNGLPYASEQDSIRVPTLYGRQRTTASSIPLYRQNIYQSETASIPIATGREARLIRMEAAYQANDPSWFDQLNTMRTEVGLDAIPAMPATDTGKVNLIFHERAFWMYRTGHRLGDMRRLISRYGRDPETVFPTGDYPIFGLKYGNATSIHFVTKLQMDYNPNITHGCTTP